MEKNQIIRIILEFCSDCEDYIDPLSIPEIKDKQITPNQMAGVIEDLNGKGLFTPKMSFTGSGVVFLIKITTTGVELASNELEINQQFPLGS